MKAVDLDQAQRDLVEAIDKKDFSKWQMKIQVMTDEQDPDISLRNLTTYYNSLNEVFQKYILEQLNQTK